MNRKIKTAIILLLFQGFSNVVISAEKDVTYLVENHVAEYIKQFQEPLYKNGGNGSNRISVRLTILRSHDNPVMIIWYPYDDFSKNSYLVVKKMKLQKKPPNSLDDDNHNFKIYYNKRINLDKSISDNLTDVIGSLVKIDTMDKAEWKGEELDGSQWIYEFASENGGLAIHRQSPIHHNKFDVKNVTKNRLIEEMGLTTFGVMLWTLSNNGEKSLY